MKWLQEFWSLIPLKKDFRLNIKKQSTTKGAVKL
jgi:hypothetical protein